MEGEQQPRLHDAIESTSELSPSSCLCPAVYYKVRCRISNVTLTRANIEGGDAQVSYQVSLGNRHFGCSMLSLASNRSLATSASLKGLCLRSLTRRSLSKVSSCTQHALESMLRRMGKQSRLAVFAVPVSLTFSSLVKNANAVGWVTDQHSAISRSP